MRKYQFLILLVAFAIGFLIIQLLTYQAVKQDIGPVLYSNTIVLEAFLDVCTNRALVVTILEPNVVRHYMDGDHGQHTLFCEKRGNHGCRQTTFGVLNAQGFPAAQFRKVGFNIYEVTVNDPRVQSVAGTQSSIITTHYILQLTNQNNHIIHVVVLLERADDSSSYLWHSPIRWPDTNMPLWLNQDYLWTDLSFSASSGAYDRFLTRKIRENGYEVLLPENLLSQLKHPTFIECNYTRAQEFYRRTGKLLANNNDEFVSNAKTVMLKGREILNKLGVPFWLSSGNCLGWYRQCGIIPYSQDVDFGIWIADHDERIIPAFQGGGFTLKHIFGKVSDSYELSFVHVQTGVKLDLFFFYVEEDHMWNGGTEYSTGNKYKYIFPTFSLCWTDLLSMKFRVPCETLSYVEANYGKNWIEPVTSWDWKESPPNVRENGVWSDEEWDDVIQVYDNIKLEDIGLNFKH